MFQQGLHYKLTLFIRFNRQIVSLKNAVKASKCFLSGPGLPSSQTGDKQSTDLHRSTD